MGDQGRGRERGRRQPDVGSREGTCGHRPGHEPQAHRQGAGQREGAAVAGESVRVGAEQAPHQCDVVEPEVAAPVAEHLRPAEHRERQAPDEADGRDRGEGQVPDAVLADRQRQPGPVVVPLVPRVGEAVTEPVSHLHRSAHRHRLAGALQAVPELDVLSRRERVVDPVLEEHVPAKHRGAQGEPASRPADPLVLGERPAPVASPEGLRGEVGLEPGEVTGTELLVPPGQGAGGEHHIDVEEHHDVVAGQGRPCHPRGGRPRALVGDHAQSAAARRIEGAVGGTPVDHDHLIWPARQHRVQALLREVGAVAHRNHHRDRDGLGGGTRGAVGDGDVLRSVGRDGVAHGLSSSSTWSAIAVDARGAGQSAGTRREYAGTPATDSSSTAALSAK